MRSVVSAIAAPFFDFVELRSGLGGKVCANGGTTFARRSGGFQPPFRCDDSDLRLEAAATQRQQ
jgi:hypothetical protein